MITLINRRLFVVVILLVPLAVFSLLKKEEAPKKDLDYTRINVRLKLSETGEIIELPLEEYLIGVVAAEMPALFHEEALKAQAVASRSFALSRMKGNKNFDVVDTTDSQAYITKEKMQEKWGEDFAVYYEKIKNSVKATENIVLIYDKEIITAYFFAMSNGYTENAELVFKEAKDYLQSVESIWDNNSLRNYNFEVKFSRAEFCEKLVISCANLIIAEPSRSESNRVLEIKINDKVFSGTDFRKILGLRSTDFDIDIKSEKVYITTRGYGHGVGMSQYGANGMASVGKNYQEILKYYYRDVIIKNLKDV